MPQYLRAITRAKWILGEQPEWVAKDDIAGDLLSELITRGNTLSVWRIEEDKPELQELIAAIDALDTDALQRAADPMVRGLIETQRELDERLGRVLGAAASVFNDIAPGARSGGYTAAGRLRGGAE